MGFVPKSVPPEMTPFFFFTFNLNHLGDAIVLKYDPHDSLFSTPSATPNLFSFKHDTQLEAAGVPPFSLWRA